MPTDVVKFGDGLELDRDSYELRLAGRALKLERIPLDILFLLVERRGGLVSREDIVANIWGKDVFLDTDNSINSAIRKIRQALKDDPENPIFVQTVTGKGYRFIAVVSVNDGPSTPQSMLASWRLTPRASRIQSFPTTQLRDPSGNRGPLNSGERHPNTLLGG